MIALMLAIQAVSPAHEAPAAARPIDRPVSYRGTCQALDKGFAAFEFEVRASGGGADRRLAIVSTDPRLASAVAAGTGARRKAQRTIENFEIASASAPKVLTVEWTASGGDAWLSIGDPVVPGRPMVTDWYARCALDFEERS